MRQFLEGKLNEKQLLDKTAPGSEYSCIYLCSATTLPEARGKGETKKLCISAIKEIQKTNPVKTLFVWPFSPEGERLAESVAMECGLDLQKKKHQGNLS